MRAAGWAILGAEEIVRREWRRELLHQRDDMQAALNAAGDRCDDAYRVLVEATETGDPAQITAACATLQNAVQVTHQSAIACDLLSRALRAELDLLSRTTNQRIAGTARFRPGRRAFGPEPAPKPAEEC